MAKIRILSLDGGGIRGIIPGKILTILEEKIREKTGDKNKNIADCFDIIAGTSTGGILATGLLCPDENGKAKFSAKDMLNLYMSRGEEIFDISLWQKFKSGGGVTDEKYDNRNLREALEDYFGDTKLSELLKPSLITAYNIRDRKTEFFNQMDAKADDNKDFFARDVALATAAAPTYFECVRIKSMTNIPKILIDGGIFANNPALCAYSEVRNEFPDHPSAKDMVMLSIGTGYEKDPYYYQNAKDWGLIEWAKPLLGIMMSGVSETINFQLRQIFDTIENPEQYLRIDGDLKFANPAMDDASKENMLKLEEDAATIAGEYNDKLDKFVDILCS